MLFDTHLHLINKESLAYPWLSDYPALNQDNSLEAYGNLARKLGILGCFHMEADVAEAQIGAEITHFEALSQSDPSLLRGMIAACRPEGGSFAKQIENALEGGFVRGFRRVLHVVPDEVSTTTLFRDNIKRLSGTGLTFDLCFLPRQLHLAAQLADHCPEVTFILDHCGVPDVADGALDPWRREMRDLAKRPNLRVKISGIIAYAAKDVWSLNDLRPYVEETAGAFGTDRLLWGSDSPVCNLGGGLPTWVAATHALTEDWLPHERDAFYHLNAYKLWDL